MFLRFFVPGHPAPQGSKRAFALPGRDGAKPRAVMTESSSEGLRDWRATVRDFAMRQGPTPFGPADPLRLLVVCAFRRPLGDFNGKGELRRKPSENAGGLHVKTPDGDKLLRAVCDAMRKVLYHDDRQIVGKTIERAYTACEEGAYFELSLATDLSARARALLVTLGYYHRPPLGIQRGPELELVPATTPGVG